MKRRFKIITLLLIQAFSVVNVAACAEVINSSFENNAHSKETLSPQVNISAELFQQGYMQAIKNKKPEYFLVFDEIKVEPFLNLIGADKSCEIRKDKGGENLYLKTNKGIYRLSISRESTNGIIVEKMKDSAGNVWEMREGFAEIVLIERGDAVPLPEPFLMKSIPFDALTITDIEMQAEKVISMIIQDNDYEDRTKQELLKLKQKIMGGERIDPLPENTKGQDADFWNKDINDISDGFMGKNWNDSIPHIVGISYFYRLILEIVDYWGTGKDPFAKAKNRELKTTLNDLPAILEELEQSKNPLSFLLLNSLWKNNFDPINPINSIPEGQELLVNDVDIAVKGIQSDEISIIDYECDNAASEIVADLCLIRHLLKNNLVEKVNLRVKNYPILISDTTSQDVKTAIDEFCAHSNRRVNSPGNELKKFIETGALNVVTSQTSTTGTALKYHESEYQESDLIILKGDLNYRRITGNRYWGVDTNINDVVPENMKPLLIIRTVKNPITIGADKRLVEKLSKADAQWYRIGLGGIVQWAGSQLKDRKTVIEIKPTSSFNQMSLIHQAI